MMPPDLANHKVPGGIAGDFLLVYGAWGQQHVPEKDCTFCTESTSRMWHTPLIIIDNIEMFHWWNNFLDLIARRDKMKQWCN